LMTKGSPSFLLDSRENRESTDGKSDLVRNVPDAQLNS